MPKQTKQTKPRLTLREQVEQARRNRVPKPEVEQENPKPTAVEKAQPKYILVKSDSEEDVKMESQPKPKPILVESDSEEDVKMESQPKPKPKPILDESTAQAVAVMKAATKTPAVPIQFQSIWRFNS